jgi:hypothetical protein
MQRHAKVLIVALLLAATCAVLEDLVLPSIRWGMAASLVLWSIILAAFQDGSRDKRVTVTLRPPGVYHTNPTSPDTLSLACVRRI